jgi:hypothetical protein
MTLPILAEFANKRATPHQVLRQLIGHDGWFAPLLWAGAACKTDKFEKICMYGESTLAADRLCLFTSADTAAAAQARYAPNGNLGLFAGPSPGVTLFEHLPRGLKSVEINALLPPEQGFFLQGEGIDIARSLGKAIALERALFGKGDDVVERLIDFDRYILLRGPNGAAATAVGAAGMKNPAMVFLADDAIEPVRATSGGALAQHRPFVWSGEELFTRFHELGVDGVLLLMDPKVIKAKPLDGNVCSNLAQSVRDRAEVARLEAIARASDEET